MVLARAAARVLALALALVLQMDREFERPDICWVRSDQRLNLSLYLYLDFEVHFGRLFEWASKTLVPKLVLGAKHELDTDWQGSVVPGGRSES